MPDPKTLKLLVVEDDPEDAEFLCEALIEVEERRLWGACTSANIVEVGQLSDALDCLRHDWFDAILLNLSLPDHPALLDCFLEVNSASRGTPIVVLADEEDPSLANRLLREGAQDVFLKTEIDCVPLARCLRHAIERQRRTRGLRSSPFVDDLTGTMTRSGFLTIGEHYRTLSKHQGPNLTLATLELAGLQEGKPEDRDCRELLLIRAGEVLRGTFPAPAIVGRLERWRFGLITAGLSDSAVMSLLGRAASQIEDAALIGHRQIASVHFSLWPVEREDNIEEILVSVSDAQSASRFETVMLAD